MPGHVTIRKRLRMRLINRAIIFWSVAIEFPTDSRMLSVYPSSNFKAFTLTHKAKSAYTPVQKGKFLSTNFPVTKSAKRINKELKYDYKGNH